MNQQIQYINYLCEHQYFLYCGNFKNEKFIKSILEIYNKMKSKNMFKSSDIEHIPLFLFIEFNHQLNDDFGIYNIYFKDKTKEECLNLIIKDCHNKYKEKE